MFWNPCNFILEQVSKKLYHYTKARRLKHSHKKYTVWKFARGYCLCYCKTFLLVPDSTECTKKIFDEECSILFVSPEEE